MKKSIVWLASYPKSGNTWLRVFIANYLANSTVPVSINQVHELGTGDGLIEHYRAVAGLGLNLADVASTMRLRPKVLQGIASNGADVNLVKTHNIRTTAWGVELIPPQFTRSAIYVMRNPLDMVLSYARHYELSHEKAAEAICHPNNGLAADRRGVGQLLCSWGEHVACWTHSGPYPLLVLRYEDLLSQPEQEFARVIEHLGLQVDNERLRRSIQHSSFDQLQQQEKQQGFIERRKGGDMFFGRGQSGIWRDELSPELVKYIRQRNKRMMKKYGYWND